MLFCVMLSCRSLKTEVQDERYKVKGEREMEIQTEKKSNLTQNENLSQDQAENQATEIVTAEFDTLDSKPVLKKLRIERTVSDRTIHAEQQIESHASGTEATGERYKVKRKRKFIWRKKQNRRKIPHFGGLQWEQLYCCC